MCVYCLLSSLKQWLSNCPVGHCKSVSRFVTASCGDLEQCLILYSENRADGPYYVPGANYHSGRRHPGHTLLSPSTGEKTKAQRHCYSPPASEWGFFFLFLHKCSACSIYQDLMKNRQYEGKTVTCLLSSFTSLGYEHPLFSFPKAPWAGRGSH